MNAKEVQDFLGVSRTTAYQLINEMNEELIKMGYRTQIGKVNRQYFMDKYCYVFSCLSYTKIYGSVSFT